MKKHDKLVQTFTKKWVDRLLPYFMLCIATSYVLSYLDKNPLEQLSITVMTGGIAIFLGYMLKAFFETYSEEKNKLKEKELHKEESEVENYDN